MFNVFIKVLRKRQALQKAKGQKMNTRTVCSAVRIAALLLVNTHKKKGPTKLKFCSTSYLTNIILTTNKRISKLLCFGLPFGNALCCLFLHLSSDVQVSGGCLKS